MPLSTRYNVLVIDAISAIRISSLEDFKLVCHELQKIIRAKNPGKLHFAPNIKDALESIVEFITHPNLYVELPQDYRAFTDLVKTEIQNGIQRFQRMSIPEKEAYIENQCASNLRRDNNHSRMKKAETRRSRAYEIMLRHTEDADFREDETHPNLLSFLELVLVPVYCIAIGLFAIVNTQNPAACISLIACNLLVVPYLLFDYLKERIKASAERVFPFFYRSETEQELRMLEAETTQTYNL